MERERDKKIDPLHIVCSKKFPFLLTIVISEKWRVKVSCMLFVKKREILIKQNNKIALKALSKRATALYSSNR